MDGFLLVMNDPDVGSRPEHHASCVSGLFGIGQLQGTLCVFLVPFLDRHIAFRSFLCVLLLASAILALSFPSLSGNSRVSAPLYIFSQPWVNQTTFPPTHSIICPFNLHCLESYLLNHPIFLFPLLNPGPFQQLSLLLFSHRLVREEKGKKCHSNCFSPLSDIALKQRGENNTTAPPFCALVGFVCPVCSWLSSILGNIHAAFQRTVYHFVDVIIMAFSSRITTAVTVTTRKCSPTHFSDKKLPGVLRLPMVCQLDRDGCSKGIKGRLIMCTVFRIVIFPPNSLQL